MDEVLPFVGKDHNFVFCNGDFERVVGMLDNAVSS